MKRLESRLLALESAKNVNCGDVRKMSDRQLKIIVRDGVRELEAKAQRTEDDQRRLDLFRLALAEDTDF